VMLGAERLLRIGTCGALDPALGVGELVIARDVICDDGTSRALGAGDRATPASELLAALRAAANGNVVAGTIVSTDLFYDADGRGPGWIAGGAIAVEMEAAAVFTMAAKRGVAAGCALLVSNSLRGERAYIDAARLEDAEIRLGQLALSALSYSPLEPS